MYNVIKNISARIILDVVSNFGANNRGRKTNEVKINEVGTKIRKNPEIVSILINSITAILMFIGSMNKNAKKNGTFDMVRATRTAVTVSTVIQ